MSALSILCNERSGTIAMGHCGNYIYGNKSDICPLDWENLSQDTSYTQILITEVSQVNIYQLACL